MHEPIKGRCCSRTASGRSLLGSIYAGLAILVWLPVFMGQLSLVSAFIPRDWHVHEMLYGFLPAVITGFLFTAIRTGPGGCRCVDAR